MWHGLIKSTTILVPIKRAHLEPYMMVAHIKRPLHYASELSVDSIVRLRKLLPIHTFLLLAKSTWK